MPRSVHPIAHGIQKGIEEIPGATTWLNHVFFGSFSSMVLSGCTNETIVSVGRILKDCYDKASVSTREADVCQMIKSWAKATRTILADEPYTREVFQHSVGYSRKITNLRTQLAALGCDEQQIENIAIHQGERSIPPFLLDKNLVGILGPRPTQELRIKVCYLTSIGRATPQPNNAEILKTSKSFKKCIERLPRLNFEIEHVVHRAIKSLPKSHSKRGNWSISSRSSKDYSRKDGGKSQEFVVKVINLFMKKKIKDVWPELDTVNHDWFDLTGELVFKAGLSPESVIGIVSYQHLGVHEDLVDVRLGHIGLLWACENLLTADKEHGVRATSTTGRFLWKRDEVPEYTLKEDAIFSSRIELMPEQGWKCRTITLSELAAIIVCSTARDFCMEVLLSDQINKIGLQSPAKLWNLINEYNGKPRLSVIKKFCLSVDLTTATDSFPRPVIKQTLNGFFRAADFKDKTFMRFAFDIALSDRQFYYNNNAYEAPVVHRCGIMMGEMLSGVFLNVTTYTVRCILPEWHKFCMATLKAGGLQIEKTLKRSTKNDDCTGFLLSYFEKSKDS